MPVDVLTEIEIARPRDEVAAFASDPTNATLLIRGEIHPRLIEHIRANKEH